MSLEDLRALARAPIPPAVLAVRSDGEISGAEKAALAEALESFARVKLASMRVALPSSELLPAESSFSVSIGYGSDRVELRISPVRRSFFEAVGPLRSVSDANRALGRPGPGAFSALASRFLGLLFPQSLQLSLEATRDAIARELAASSLKGVAASLASELSSLPAMRPEWLQVSEPSEPKPRSAPRP